MTIEEECVITVDGKTYDLTKWADYHPGGSLIRQYNGRDATEIFKAFHGPEAMEKLKRFPALAQPTKRQRPMPKDQRSIEILVAFEELKMQLEKEGFMKTNPLWYTYKTLTTWMWIGVALYCQASGWYLASAIFTGLFWQQLGWLGHEYAHHQIFADRQKNNMIGLFCGNILQGFSMHWWKDRHNSHHATTNILDADPDIDNIPMLAWAKSDLIRAPAWCRKTIPYQAYYFLLLLPLLRLTWAINSIFFVRDMRTSRYQQYRDDFRKEAIGLAIHWTWVVLQLWFLPSWQWILVHFLVSELLAGFGIAIVVFFNHYSCEKYEPALAENFVCLQLYTTRNMTPGIFTDWICGGLNYQIEHHLFPTMPRHNLYKCSHKVKEFCAAHNLPYLCSSFYSGLLTVLDFLNTVGDICVQLNKAEAQTKSK